MVRHSELGKASAVIMKYVSRALALWVICKVSSLPVVEAIFSDKNRPDSDYRFYIL